MDESFKRADAPKHYYDLIFLAVSLAVICRIVLLYSLYLDDGDKAQYLLSVNNTTDYSSFSEVMNTWGYTWEPVEVTTDDGYILTSFHITGPLQSEKKASILIQHGLFGDAQNWLRYVAPGGNKPFQL